MLTCKDFLHELSDYLDETLDAENLVARAAGVSLTPVPQSITSGSGFIWGGNSGARSLIENPAVAGSGFIWTGGRSSLSSTSGTVTGEGAVWVGDGRSRK